MSAIKFDKRRLPFVTKQLTDGLYTHQDAANGRHIVPVEYLPVVNIELSDPIIANEHLGWVKQIAVRKPVYADLQVVGKRIETERQGRDSQTWRTAFMIAQLATVAGEDGEKGRIDAASVAEALSMKNIGDFNDAVNKVSEEGYVDLPEHVELWRTVQVTKPMSYHADILSSDEGVDEVRMAKYLADVVKFTDFNTNGMVFSTTQTMIDNLTVKDFRALTAAVREASELTFPLTNEAN